MSDADDQTGGSGDPRYDKPPASEPRNKPNGNDSNTDDDVMTKDLGRRLPP